MPEINLKMLPLNDSFPNATVQQRSLTQKETQNPPGGISPFLLSERQFQIMLFFPSVTTPPSFPQHDDGGRVGGGGRAVAGAALLNQRLKEKAVRKLERVAARGQMLLPYKLVEDYAQPAVPYKCPVFIPHHDPLCLSYGPASGQFHPQLPYIYSNQALPGDLFMSMPQYQTQDHPEVLTCSMTEN